jgi:hypothetical protein
LFNEPPGPRHATFAYYARRNLYTPLSDSEKVHLLRYAHPSSLQRTLQVRLTPLASQALQLELFANPLILYPEKVHLLRYAL